MDTCSIAVAAALCALAGILWWTVLDPSRPRTARDRLYADAGRTVGLEHRSRRQPLGPRLIGTRRSVEVDVELEPDGGAGPLLRATFGPPAAEPAFAPRTLDPAEVEHWLQRLDATTDQARELEAAIEVLSSLAAGGTLAAHAGRLELAMPAPPTTAEHLVELLDATVALAAHLHARA